MSVVEVAPSSPAGAANCGRPLLSRCEVSEGPGSGAAKRGFCGGGEDGEACVEVLVAAAPEGKVGEGAGETLGEGRASFATPVTFSTPSASLT